jgi:hypothetical protein
MPVDAAERFFLTPMGPRPTDPGSGKSLGKLLSAPQQRKERPPSWGGHGVGANRTIKG